MDTPKSKVPRAMRSDTRPGFDITKVVGRVVLDEDGVGSAHEAAFAIIARQDDNGGTYTFPMSNGGTCNVTVEYSGEPQPV